MKSNRIGWAIVMLLAVLFVAAIVPSESQESLWRNLLVLPLTLCCVCLMSLRALYLGVGTSPLWRRLLTLPVGEAVLWLTDRSGGINRLGAR